MHTRTHTHAHTHMLLPDNTHAHTHMSLPNNIFCYFLALQNVYLVFIHFAYMLDIMLCEWSKNAQEHNNHTPMHTHAE